MKYIVEQLSALDDKKRIELINTKNDQGNTPLHWAALNGNLEVVEILVKAGGDCKVICSMPTDCFSWPSYLSLVP